MGCEQGAMEDLQFFFQVRVFKTSASAFSFMDKSFPSSFNLNYLYLKEFSLCPSS